MLFRSRKRVIFASMGDSQRENAWFSLKWGICGEKTRDFRVKWEICKENTRDFRIKWGICEEKTRDFRLNVGFAKRKRVIFA